MGNLFNFHDLSRKIVMATTPPSRQQLIRPIVLITFFSGLSFAASFLLQIILAAYFGAEQSMDAYLVASTIPNLLNAVLLGSLNIVLIPIFIQSKLHHGRESAWQLVSSFINLFAIGLLLLAGIGIFTARMSVYLLAPGFNPHGEVFKISINLTYILFPSIIFTGLAGLLSSIYKAEHKFVLPALAPFLNALIMVISVIILSPMLGISSVALGVLIGSIAQFILLVPILFSAERYYPIIDWKHPAFRQTFELMLPWILAAIIYKGNLVVDRFLASQLPEGSISHLGYAYKLTIITATILTEGISTVFFPTMSLLDAGQDRKGLRETISLGVRLVMVVVMPIIITILLLNVPILELLLERGAFNHHDTLQTGSTWVGYLGAVVGLSFGNIISFAFYAIKDTKTPAKVGVTGMFVNIVVAFILTPYLAQLGPAIGFSVMSLFNLSVMTILLSKRLNGLEWDKIFHSGFRISLAAVPMGLIMSALYTFLKPYELDKVHHLLTIVGSIILGGTVYLLLLFIFRVREIQTLYTMISKRVMNANATTDR